MRAIVGRQQRRSVGHVVALVSGAADGLRRVAATGAQAVSVDANVGRVAGVRRRVAVCGKFREDARLGAARHPASPTRVDAPPAGEV